MGKLRSKVLLVLVLGSLLVIACQTAGTPPQSQSKDQQLKASQSNASQSNGSQLADQSQAAALSDSTTALSPAGSPRGSRSGASAQLTSLIRNVDTFGKLKVKLFGVQMPPPEIMALIVAGVILFGGASWSLATRRLARRAR
jgi:hypothetical protein